MSPQQVMSDQNVVKPGSRTDFGRPAGSSKSGRRWVRIVLVVLGLVAAGSGGAYLLASGRGQDGSTPSESTRSAAGNHTSASQRCR